MQRQKKKIIKLSNIYVTEFLKGEKRGKMEKKKKDIMEKIPNLVKKINLQIKKTQRNTKRISTKTMIPRYSTINCYIESKC